MRTIDAGSLLGIGRALGLGGGGSQISDQMILLTGLLFLLLLTCRRFHGFLLQLHIHLRLLLARRNRYLMGKRFHPLARRLDVRILCQGEMDVLLDGMWTLEM